MKKKTISILLAITLMVSQLSMLSTIATATNELTNSALYLRTDSLTATNIDGTAKIVAKSESGVTTGYDGFIGGNGALSNDVLQLQSGSFITMQFDLPVSAIGGQIRLLGTIPADATVSIETADGAYYTFSTYNYERPARGVYFYAFGNSTWVDNQKSVRIKVAAGNSLVMLHSAMIYEQSPIISSSAVTIKPLTQEELLYARYYSTNMDYYFDNGTNPTNFTNNGFSIYDVKVSTKVDSLSYNYDGMVNGAGPFNLAYKDANDLIGFTGNPSYFTLTSSKSGNIANFTNIKVIDPDNIANSGDEYRELFYIVYGNQFLKYLTLTPIQNSYSSYLRTDSLTAINVSGTAKIVANSESGVTAVYDGFYGGNGTLPNDVIKLQSGASITTQFDLPVSAVGGQIKILGTIPADASVSIETPDGSYYTFNPYNYERPGRGVYFYGFGNSTWVDNQKRVRIKITAGASEAMIHSILVYTNDPLIESTTTIKPLSQEELLYARYYNTSVNYYFDNAIIPTVFTNNGFAIYNVKISAKVNSISYSYDGLVNGAGSFNLGYKDANDAYGFTGSLSCYTITSSNSGNIVNFSDIAIINPDGVANSGDEYRELLFIVYGNEFLRSLTLTPAPPITLDSFNVSHDKIITNVIAGTTLEQFRNTLNPANGVDVSFTNVLSNDGTIGTGTKVRVAVNGYTTDYTILLFGDVNGDGKIDLNDLVSIRNNILESSTIEGIFATAGDLYVENNITLNDLVGMMEYISEGGTINQNLLA